MKQNWEIKKLGEICELITKGTTPTSLGHQFTDEGINFIKVESLTESGKIITNKVAYISEECHQVLKRSQLKENDILFSIAGALGRIGIVNKDILPANTNQALAIIRLSKDVNISIPYLAKYFNSSLISDEIEKLKGGAAQQNLSLGQLNNLEIPLPPLQEQQRIVAILDEAFRAIDKAKANTEQNLKNAKELFERTKSEIFDKLKGEKVLIATVCNEIFAGGDAPKDYSKEKNEKHNIPIIANAVKDNGLYGYSDRERVSLPSITIAARGSGTGHTEIRYEPFFPIVRLIVLTPNTEKITLEFLKYSVQNLDILSSGSAIPQLTVPMLKEYAISLPPIKDQQSIVSKLDALREQTKKLEAVYEKKLQDLEELKKSVLSKAFSGEL